MKLNALLAKTDQLAASWKKSIEDYIKFFKDKGGAFLGEKKTYIPRPETIDLPTERVNKIVVTTVGEKFTWLEETHADYIDALFAQEATNAAGNAKASLSVGGFDFGTLSSLELLRLKSLIENSSFETMLANIPVRQDDREWSNTTEEQYQNREIFESSKISGERKSTTKESYILTDPNIGTGRTDYKPQIATKDTVMVLGDFTHQHFTGEWSHRQRAEILRRRTQLLAAITTALKEANDVEATTSSVTSKKIFSYLLGN
jgi:hypothetical protein